MSNKKSDKPIDEKALGAASRQTLELLQEIISLIADKSNKYHWTVKEASLLPMWTLAEAAYTWLHMVSETAKSSLSYDELCAFFVETALPKVKEEVDVTWNKVDEKMKANAKSKPGS